MQIVSINQVHAEHHQRQLRDEAARWRLTRRAVGRRTHVAASARRPSGSVSSGSARPAHRALGAQTR